MFSHLKTLTRLPTVTAFAVGLMFIIFSHSGFAMSILDAGKVCTFSSVSGVITYNGKPVSGATVTRTTDYQKKKSSTTTTAEDGSFSFPAAFERSIMSMLPQEFSVGQTMYVRVGDQDHKIWSGVKRKPEENHEAKGKPIVITCELTDEQQVLQVNNQPFITMCKWDVEADIIDTGF